MTLLICFITTSNIQFLLTLVCCCLLYIAIWPCTRHWLFNLEFTRKHDPKPSSQIRFLPITPSRPFVSIIICALTVHRVCPAESDGNYFWFENDSSTEVEDYTKQHCCFMATVWCLCLRNCKERLLYVVNVCMDCVFIPFFSSGRRYDSQLLKRNRLMI